MQVINHNVEKVWLPGIEIWKSPTHPPPPAVGADIQNSVKTMVVKLEPGVQGEQKVTAYSLCLYFSNVYKFLHKISKCLAERKIYIYMWSFSFIKNMSGVDKIMQFQPRHLFPPVVCGWLRKEPVYWWWDEDTD